MKNSILNTKFKIIYLLCSLPSLFLLDQLSKAWATENLLGNSGIDFLSGHFQLIYARNTGAFLGLGGELSREIRFVIFALIVIFGLGLMLWYLIKKENSKLNLIGYSFILAGGLGNLYDRLVNANGFVVDFLFIQLYGPLKTGIFNIADVEIVIGVVIVVYSDYLHNHLKNRKITNADKKIK